MVKPPVSDTPSRTADATSPISPGVPADEDEEPPSSGTRWTGLANPLRLRIGPKDVPTAQAVDDHSIEHEPSHAMQPTFKSSMRATLTYTPLNVLLLCIPAAWALHYTHQGDTLTFVFSALGLVPLAALLGFGTEQFALRTTQTIGGLLNASLGNVVELLIAGLALKRCDLQLVQSSLLGGLLSNLLLVLGMAFLVGGYRFHQQEFQPMAAQLNSSLMTVAVIALIVPAAFHEFLGERIGEEEEGPVMLQLSRGSAVVLMLMYVAYLFFQFYSHPNLYKDTVQTQGYSARSSLSTTSGSFVVTTAAELPPPVTASSPLTTPFSVSPEQDAPKVNIATAIGVLVASTVLAYFTAECLVDSVNGLASDSSVSKEWITLIVLPIISNAGKSSCPCPYAIWTADGPSLSAEHATAVVVATKGKFDLALSVAVGSCIQIALFVVPLLVLVAWAMGRPLTLVFDPVETIVRFSPPVAVPADPPPPVLVPAQCLFLSVLLVKFSIEDGKSHWMSGVVLVGACCASLPGLSLNSVPDAAVYVVIAISFWYFPDSTAPAVAGMTCS
ncbi:calcium/proton exchanger [Punctularia strigosozonata HHB-11173 SS5]|uniref:calcium/proton exchanger n=1 Tax=Punctularia strigosozonata (strain HHB-11173) TaxID=741275 RepID=UPI00044174EA|nr:calcium/proton exchanger [Punctularia strigosozonata HHB-11173 SS5]EIN10818.1 calcium/proton exchanger [Punctularia strigosozonata HHB-11173 SS5]